MASRKARRAPAPLCVGAHEFPCTEKNTVARNKRCPGCNALFLKLRQEEAQEDALEGTLEDAQRAGTDCRGFSAWKLMMRHCQ